MRDEREMAEHDVLFADVVTHLTNGFEEGQRFDVADRAADFDDAYVGAARFGDAFDVRLDLVRDVRNNLNRSAEILTAPFFFDDGVIDLTGRDVIDAEQILVDEPLVVAEIQIGFGAVFGYKNLAVLIRVHRAGVDVDVRIQLLDRNADAASFEQPPERGCGDAFTERTDDAAGKENILRHLGMLLFR